MTYMDESTTLAGGVNWAQIIHEPLYTVNPNPEKGGRVIPVGKIGRTEGYMSQVK